MSIQNIKVRAATGLVCHVHKLEHKCSHLETYYNNLNNIINLL